MPATFLVVPEWQGSVSARAMSHADGALAIHGDLPSSATVLVDVPVEAGDALGTGVHRYSAVRWVRERTAEALGAAPGVPVAIGGDCGIALAPVAASAAAHPGGLAVLWLDAHPDLNTPETSPSGAFNGMVLRAITGEGAEGLALEGDERVPASRIVLGGVRAVDPGEQAFIDAERMTVLAVDAFGDPDAVVAAITATGATHVYVHVDLDVLDPAAIAGLSYPLPFGAQPDTLVALVRAVVGVVPLAGASIAGFAPSSPDAAIDDLPTILRLVGALTSGAA
ncbi:arginase [Agromyces flavus]|uniref:Arginase n=1 Tax=Agromyces flavus TaxID=589382 RepID=A0A1H1U367_9MICO|nr:arginase family protein [Agromyces flavus]MCP2368300.1 arginase [Agromyces flavus]GGI47761.1 arginase [Agromyces flavus]SDS66975.1 arginase [Agromyces flavus]